MSDKAIGSPISWSSDTKKTLPKSPGVYWYTNKDGEVIYVGKAKNLKNRLLSYSRVKQLLPKTKRLVTETVRTNFKELESELEALLVEAELIKKYQPQYNVALKDDKSPIYIAITKDDFPKILLVRKQKVVFGKTQKKFTHAANVDSYFGPYQSAWKAKQLVKLLRKVIPYCNASSVDIKKKKACFYYHIGQCPGVCVGKISKTEYKEYIQDVKLFLRGRKGSLINKLTRKINEYAQNQEYEKAQQAKNQLEAFKYVTTNYRSKIKESMLPQLMDDIGLQKTTDLRHLLRKYIPLPVYYSLKRIECYDVSNIMGRLATTSMVTFIDGLADKSEYKKFRIKTLHRPNDVGMMKEALSRRIKHEEWGIPNVILIDGGKTQLRAAREIIPWDIPVVSIAKRPDRLVVPITKLIEEQGERKYKVVDYVFHRLEKNVPSTQLLEQLRDEAHRFAKSYHKKLHEKNIVLD